MNGVARVRNVRPYTPGSGMRARELLSVPPPLYFAGQGLRWLVTHPTITAAILLGGWVAYQVRSVYAGAAVCLTGIAARALGGVLWEVRRSPQGFGDLRQILPILWRKFRTTRRWADIAEGHKLVDRRTGKPLQLKVTGLTSTGITATVNLSRAFRTADELATIADNIASGAGVPAVTIRQGHHPGIALLVFTFTDPLGQTTPLAALPEAPKGRLAFGVTEDGLPATVRHDTSLLLVGMTGWGKSNVLWALLASLIKQGVPYRLRVIDLKGGMELSALRPFAHEYASTMTQAVGILKSARAAMTTRAELMAQKGQRKHKPTAEEPLDIVVADELLKMTTFTGGEKAREVWREMGEIASQGRAVGYVMWLASQLGQIDAVGRVRSLIDQRICLKTDSREMTDAVLGSSATALGAKAHKLTKPGMGYIDWSDGAPVRFRAVLVSDAETRQLAKGKLPNGMVPADLDDLEDGRTALYRWFDEHGRLLYVGISVNPTLRAEQHQDKPWWGLVASNSVEWFDTRAEAEQAEIAAIKSEGPAYNIAHNGTRRRARSRADADTVPLDREVAS